MEFQETGGNGGTEPAMAMDIKEEEVSMVKGGSGHGHLYLSSLDLCWRGSPYSRRILFYNTIASPTEQNAIVDNLKLSLAHLLLAFYPAAGRLVSASASAGGPPSAARPSILCDGQGVEFVVASVNGPLSLLQSSNFEPCPFFHSLARPYPLPHVPPHLLPLLSLQVTKFACGGVAIGISYSNVLADGHSIWHLMNSWAECARNEAISIQPCHNREAFKCKDALEDKATKFSLPKYNISTHEELALTTTVHKLLHVTPVMINRLKQQALKELNGEAEILFSDYDIFCALMWKSIAATKSLTRWNRTQTNICVLGDMRFRMNPPLPRGYFGNATIFGYASSDVKEIVEGPFASIARKIHQACKGCNETRLWRIVSWLELHGNVFDERSLPWMMACVNVVSSPKFKVYNVDFGWGKPIVARTSLIANPRDMLLLPGRDGGVDICFSCPKPTLNQLMQNFTNFSY